MLTVIGTLISDLLLMFHRNERPIYFISATNFNLLGIDRWVNRFRYISYIDCFDGRHTNVFVPSKSPHDSRPKGQSWPSATSSAPSTPSTGRATCT